MSEQRLVPVPLESIGPAFDEKLLETVYQEWEKEIGPVSIENIGKRVAAGITKALLAKNMKDGSVPDPVAEMMFCEGHDTAMRWWFALVFVWLMEQTK